MTKAGNAVSVRLEACAASFGPYGYALVDGGLFEDLPAELRHQGLTARPLFLAAGDQALAAAGPYLLPLGQKSDALASTLALIGDRPGGVFWHCRTGEVALFHHLRKLNAALVPRWAARGADGPRDDADAVVDAHVTFRHWDPRVLSALLPNLDAAQFARILGEADEIAFETRDSSFRRVVKDVAWPPPRRGPLRIGSAEMLALTGRRQAASRGHIVDYLRVTAPRETQGLSDDDLATRIEASEASGRRFGLLSEQALGRWAYVMAKRDWRAGEDVIDAMRSGRDPPETRIKALVDRIHRAEAEAGPARLKG